MKPRQVPWAYATHVCKCQVCGELFIAPAASVLCAGCEESESDAG